MVTSEYLYFLFILLKIETLPVPLLVSSCIPSALGQSPDVLTGPGRTGGCVCVGVAAGGGGARVGWSVPGGSRF